MDFANELNYKRGQKRRILVKQIWDDSIIDGGKYE